MKLHQAALTAAATLGLSACAFGHHYDYRDTTTTLAYHGQGRVAVAAWDQRPYVLSGDKDPHFVGLQRSLYGIPFNVSTSSGQPLATEMGKAMALSLANAGFGATPVAVPAQDQQQQAVQALLQSGLRRALLLRVNDWESDNYKNPTVVYDLTLGVYDHDGRQLASTGTKGIDDLHSKLFDSSTAPGKIVPELFQQKIQLLLDTPEIQAALR